MNKNKIEFVNDGLKKIKNRLGCLSLQSKDIYYLMMFVIPIKTNHTCHTQSGKHYAYSDSGSPPPPSNLLSGAILAVNPCRCSPKQYFIACSFQQLVIVA